MGIQTKQKHWQWSL